MRICFYTSQEQLDSAGVSSGEAIPFSIYHDSNIPELVKVKPVLQEFMTRVQELLAEWPRHPCLLQVKRLLLSCPLHNHWPLQKPILHVRLNNKHKGKHNCVAFSFKLDIAHYEGVNTVCLLHCKSSTRKTHISLWVGSMLWFSFWPKTYKLSS